MHNSRIQSLTPNHPAPGPVIYWMSRDMRVQDNWALWKAWDMAQNWQQPLWVVFNFVPQFLGATERQYEFLIQGLKEVEAHLRKLHIPFIVTFGQPRDTLPKVLRKKSATLLITDFSPLKINRKWKHDLISEISPSNLWEVDAHNIIPPWVTSPKAEYAARTIRPKIHRFLPEWLTEIPSIKTQNPNLVNLPTPIDWEYVRSHLSLDSSVPSVDWVKPGEKAAHEVLNTFVQDRLDHYHQTSNQPQMTQGLSDLSPYLHFGHISAQRVAIEIKHSGKNPTAINRYLEELIVRRELSENFCYYNPHYDSWQGFPTWAQNTLNEHRFDERPNLYTLPQLEQAKTHDPLWNASQMEMVKRGKMHGYIRMYWAKKILEWTQSPEQALEWTIYLNDRYELDGRDPVGYTNIAWSIGGVHDHGWTERPIFGKIRYMSLASTGRKFDSKAYIEYVEQL